MNSLSMCTALVTLAGGILMSVGSVAAGAEAEVALNRQWALEAFSAKALPFSFVYGGKRIRKYFRGDFYLLSNANANPRDWCVMQYHRPDEQDGLVMAFRRDQSPYTRFDGSLFGIDPAADYQVTMYPTYDPDKPATLKGAALQKLRIDIAGCPGSVIIEYRKMAQ